MAQWSAPLRWCLHWLGRRGSRGDRRHAARYPCCLETSLRSTATVEGDPWPAKIRNIALGGLSLIASRAFASGEVLTVTLQNPARTYTRTVLVKVVHATPHPGGDWIVGAQFTRHLTDYDLKMLFEGAVPVPLPKSSVQKPA